MITKRTITLSLILNLLFSVYTIQLQWATITNIFDISPHSNLSPLSSEKAEELNIANRNSSHPNTDILMQFNKSPYESETKKLGSSTEKSAKKILFLGNSISLHGVSDSVGWFHISGMAASSINKDYIHILLEKLFIETKTPIQYKIINISDFEREYQTYDYNRLSNIKQFNPDLVVFQIGENVSSGLVNDKFRDAYVRLINNIPAKNKILTLPFWPDKEKNKQITNVALNTNSYLVDLSHLGSGIEPLNFANAEVKYKNPAIGMHPGDYGMENIANNLFILSRHLLQ